MIEWSIKYLYNNGYDVKIKYKNKDIFQKLISILVYPFNRHYMERYTTVIGDTIYFPDSGFLNDDISALRTLCHEFVHIYDSKKDGWLFNVKYLFPQILFIPIFVLYSILFSVIPMLIFLGSMIASYLILHLIKRSNPTISIWVFWMIFIASLVGASVFAVSAAGYGFILWFASLLALAPWPAYWRARYEYRGYAMNIFLNYLMHGSITDRYIHSLSENFYGMDYYRMELSRSRAVSRLDRLREKCYNGDILKGDYSEPYRICRDIFVKNGLVRNA